MTHESDILVDRRRLKRGLVLWRALAIIALVGAVLEIAAVTKTPAPSIEAVYACVKLLNKIIVLQKVGVRTEEAA